MTREAHHATPSRWCQSEDRASVKKNHTNTQQRAQAQTKHQTWETREMLLAGTQPHVWKINTTCTGCGWNTAIEHRTVAQQAQSIIAALSLPPPAPLCRSLGVESGTLRCWILACAASLYSIFYFCMHKMEYVIYMLRDFQCIINTKLNVGLKHLMLLISMLVIKREEQEGGGGGI